MSGCSFDDFEVGERFVSPGINRCRRLAKDYENLNRTATTFIRLASIRLMLRSLTRYCYPS